MTAQQKRVRLMPYISMAGRDTTSENDLLSVDIWNSGNRRKLVCIVCLKINTSLKLLSLTRVLQEDLLRTYLSTLRFYLDFQDLNLPLH